MVPEQTKEWHNTHADRNNNNNFLVGVEEQAIYSSSGVTFVYSASSFIPKSRGRTLHMS